MNVIDLPYSSRVNIDYGLTIFATSENEDIVDADDFDDVAAGVGPGALRTPWTTSTTDIVGS